jgi:ABC-2 type transport system permease protein
LKRIYYIVKKEIVEMSREFMSFALLLLMPVTFILIMSLAMQALFQGHSKFQIKILAVDYDRTGESRKFLDIVKNIKNMSFKELEGGVSTDELSQKVISGDYKFALVVNKDFSSYIRDINRGPDSGPVTMLVDPTIQSLTQLVVKNQVEIEIVKLKLNTFFTTREEMLAYAGMKKENLINAIEGAIQTNYVYKNRQDAIIPSAAQQSVPAWLVFSMYFLVIPISTIFHTEKTNGTLLRIRSINIKARHLIIGKIFSYYIVSLLQVVCMLCVGRFIVPLLGGDTIQFGNSFFSLFVIASCTGLNAISYGLMISSISKNTMMAASLGVMLNITLSAIGGIMVPKFVMPAFLQNLSVISPFSWGMEGFLDIMLRNGSLYDILPECSLLIVTGSIMLFATGVILKKKNV